MKSVLIAFSFFFIINSTQGQGQVYCGRRLADTLAYFCYNPLINGDTSNSLLMKRSHAYYSSIVTDGFQWPWVPQHQAQSMRHKRQVVSECCDKPCSMDELLAYC